MCNGPNPRPSPNSATASFVAMKTLAAVSWAGFARVSCGGKIRSGPKQWSTKTSLSRIRCLAGVFVASQLSVLRAVSVANSVVRYMLPHIAVRTLNGSLDGTTTKVLPRKCLPCRCAFTNAAVGSAPCAKLHAQSSTTRRQKPRARSTPANPAWNHQGCTLGTPRKEPALASKFCDLVDLACGIAFLLLRCSDRPFASYFQRKSSA